VTTAVLTPRSNRRLAVAAGALVAVVALLGWTALALGLDQGRVRLPGVEAWRAPLVYGAPFAGLALLLLRETTNRTVRLLVGGVWIVFGALLGAILVLIVPLLVYGLGVIVVSALAARRWPSQMALATFAISGTYGSIRAFTPLTQTGPLVDVLLAGLWIALIVQVVSRRRDFDYALWPGIAALLGYGLFTAISILFAPDLYEGLRAFRQSTWYILSLVVVGYLGWKPPTRRQAAIGVVVLCAVVGAYATFRWAVGPSGKEKALAATTGDQRYDVAAGESKLQGSLPNGSVLGLWAAVTLPFCFAAALAMRGRIRLVAIAAVPLLAIGLLGSAVRTGSVAAVVGVSLVLLLYQLSRAFPGPRLGTGAAALVGFAVAVVLIYPATAGNTPEKRARYEKVLSPSTDASFQERRFKWSSALRDSTHHPLGHGLGTAGIRAGNQRFIPTATGGDVDNSYVMVAFEQGVPAMIFLIFALGLLLVGLMRRAVWTKSPERAAVAIGAAGTLAALMLMFVTRLYIESLASLSAWLIVGLGVAQFTRVEREPEAAAPGDA
jgi:hypothetical protein